MIAVVLAASAMPLFAGCSGDDALPLGEYFTRVAALATALDDANKTPLPFATRAADEATGSVRFALIEQRLRTLADGLDALEPPKDAKGAHKALIAASRGLADTARTFRVDATEPSDDAIATASGIYDDWSNACHALQDLALVYEIDVDLRCATALQQG